LFFLFKSNPSYAQKEHSIQLNHLYYHYNFKELVVPPLRCNETNWLSGYGISYNYIPRRNHFNFKMSFEFSNSKTEYDGTTLDFKPVTFDSPNKFYTIQMNFGYAKQVWRKNFYLIPFFGLDYQYWSRGKTRINLDYISHNTEYKWLFASIGVLANVLYQKFELGFDISYKHQLFNKIIFHYSDVFSSYNDPVASSNSGKGVAFLFPIKFQLNSYCYINIVPWYQYYFNGKSSVVELYSLHVLMSEIYEPKSEMNIYGVRFGLGIEF